jgi:hypothetical protein
MTTLTDRYVWGVLRAVPERQRPELEPEIRALVNDTIDARTAAGVVDAAEAERAALVELGDPEILAARYTDRRLYLIGPAHYLDYQRLLVLLVSIVAPIVALATMAAGFIAEMPAVEAIVNGLSAGFMVGLQLAFWVTLGFAAVERYGSRRSTAFRAWTPDQLPPVPSPARLTTREAVSSVVGAVVLIGVILIGPPFITASGSVPFFDPALATTWAYWFIGVALLRIGFAVIVYAARRWTWPVAIVNAILDAAFVIPVVWLLQSGQLLSAQVEADMARVGASAAIAPTTAVISVVLLAAIGWDAVSGLLRANRGQRTP